MARTDAIAYIRHKYGEMAARLVSRHSELTRMSLRLEANAPSISRLSQDHVEPTDHARIQEEKLRRELADTEEMLFKLEEVGKVIRRLPKSTNVSDRKTEAREEPALGPVYSQTALQRVPSVADAPTTRISDTTPLTSEKPQVNERYDLDKEKRSKILGDRGYKMPPRLPPSDRELGRPRERRKDGRTSATIEVDTPNKMTSQPSDKTTAQQPYVPGKGKRKNWSKRPEENPGERTPPREQIPAPQLEHEHARSPGTHRSATRSQTRDNVPSGKQVSMLAGISIRSGPNPKRVFVPTEPDESGRPVLTKTALVVVPGSQCEIKVLLDCGSSVSLVNRGDLDRLTRELVDAGEPIPKGGFLKETSVRKTAMTSPLGGRVRSSKKQVNPRIQLRTDRDDHVYCHHSMYVVPDLPYGMIWGADFFKDNAAELRWVNGTLMLSLPSAKLQQTGRKIIADKPTKERVIERAHPVRRRASSGQSSVETTSPEDCKAKTQQRIRAKALGRRQRPHNADLTTLKAEIAILKRIVLNSRKGNTALGKSDRGYDTDENAPTSKRPQRRRNNQTRSQQTLALGKNAPAGTPYERSDDERPQPSVKTPPKVTKEQAAGSVPAANALKKRKKTGRSPNEIHEVSVAPLDKLPGDKKTDPSGPFPGARRHRRRGAAIADKTPPLSTNGFRDRDISREAPMSSKDSLGTARQQRAREPTREPNVHPGNNPRVKSSRVNAGTLRAQSGTPIMAGARDVLTTSTTSDVTRVSPRVRAREPSPMRDLSPSPEFSSAPSEQRRRNKRTAPNSTANRPERVAKTSRDLVTDSPPFQTPGDDANNRAPPKAARRSGERLPSGQTPVSRSTSRRTYETTPLHPQPNKSAMTLHFGDSVLQAFFSQAADRADQQPGLSPARENSSVPAAQNTNSTKSRRRKSRNREKKRAASQ